MNGDVWVGALTTLAGAVIGGAISFLLSRQQLKDARAQRAEDALRETDRRSLDRRFAAYADFHTQTRSFRNAIRPYRDQVAPRMTIQEIDALARSAEAASSLVFLVLQSSITHKACRAVVRAISNTIGVIHELDLGLDGAPWDEMNDDMAHVTLEFEAAARIELGVSMAPE